MKTYLPEPELQIVEIPTGPSAQEKDEVFWKKNPTVNIDDLVKTPRRPGKPN